MIKVPYFYVLKEFRIGLFVLKFVFGFDMERLFIRVRRCISGVMMIQEKGMGVLVLLVEFVNFIFSR